METEYALTEEIIAVSTTETSIVSQEQREFSRSVGNPQQLRKEVEKVLKPYNTTAYSFLEYGAESMLRIEGLVNRVQEAFSTDSIVDGLSSMFSSIGGYVNSLFSSYANHEQRNMDDIQEKLNLVMKQMEAVQEDNKKKTEELKQLREQISANNSRVGSPKAKPAPPPFPPSLDRYSQQAEQSIDHPHTIPSPIFRPSNPPPIPPSPQSPQSPQSPKQIALPPPIPPVAPKKEHTFQRNPNLLTEIQQASKNVKLRKVPRNGDGTPIRRQDVETRERNESNNDVIRNKMIERIRMMEDEEPEDDVRWRESDIF